MSRGFAAIGLDNPKSGVNIGSVFRAAGVYEAKLIVLGGPRPEKITRFQTDTMRTWKHTPVILTDDIFDALPFDTVPIAVDLLPDATPLMEFTHPERAFYIFGAEDSTLDERIVKRCAHTVYVPTKHCMNLAAAVNVVLYDRLAKRS